MTDEDTQRHTLSSQLRGRLKQLRLDAGLSQRALADQLGVSVSTISMVEGGTRDTAVGTLEAWARACGARLDIVSNGEEAERLSLDHLNEQQRQIVTDLVANMPNFGPILETTLRQLVWVWSVETTRGSRRV
jgi:transcriptional regulator with XRE-family HTH domain